MTYFREVSDLLYQSQQPNRNSSYDYVRVKNLFRRAKIRDDFFQNAAAFTKYKIIGEERPEQIAQKLYGSSTYDWIVLIANNIINIRTEWPLSDSEFSDYLERKYTQTELLEPHHYETTAVIDSKGKLIIPSGKVVDSNFSITYYDGLSVTKNPVKMISVYEYEIEQNDKKRNIYVLRNRYLQTAIDDMKRIMSYGFSSQYVNDSTKKGENLRVLSPR
ncbi:hypothetical protein EBR43_10950 [bacterium]|nr:hypothetical protein [bacterium]